MLLVHAQVFDDIITGTNAIWYTPASFNAQLGSADAFAVQACTTFVSGTSPTLTVQSEHSSDNRVWLPTASAEVNTGIASDASYYNYKSSAFSLSMALIRFRITLGGVAPQCRLKLYFTGRVVGAPAEMIPLPGRIPTT